MILQIGMGMSDDNTNNPYFYLFQSKSEQDILDLLHNVNSPKHRSKRRAL